MKFLNRNLRRTANGVYQIGEHNIYIEEAGTVLIDGRRFYGPSADAVKRIVERSLSDRFDEIPEGSIRTFGGAVSAIGYIVSVGSAVLYFATVGFSPEKLSSTSFTNAATGALVGSAITVCGSMIKDWRGVDFRSPAHILSMIFFTAGWALIVVGAFKFFTPILEKLQEIRPPGNPPTSGSDHETDGMPPGMAAGFGTMAVGIGLTWVSSAVMGLRRDRRDE
ncbi:hypothetical protein ACFYNL_18025 [Streptomyces sp. NPDC007808]|uniref:hypothetical protein n=1 Tax=Streptomyces sp. NPDC007808 TaxID=3364779 RepID=UPI0036AC706B